MHISGSTESGPPERAEAHLVSGNYFQVLGVEAAAGRILRPQDNALNAPPAAVISYRFWQNRFHLDNAIVGKTVVLNGTGVHHRWRCGARIFWRENPDPARFLATALVRSADPAARVVAGRARRVLAQYDGAAQTRRYHSERGCSYRYAIAAVLCRAGRYAPVAGDPNGNSTMFMSI